MRYYTSDEHLMHQNIILYCSRDFKDVEDMTRGLVERHNSVVKSDDVVYHLGDISLHKRYVADYLRQLNGTHHLIPGNHDACHSAYKTKKRVPIQEYLDFGFASVQEQMFLTIGGEEALLCHLPYLEEGTNEDQRYKHLRPVNDGKVQLAGHVHNSWAERNRMINVGVDVRDYKPISETAIIEIMKTLPAKSV